jgi:outer membrane protein assembly factor BamB
LLNKVTKLIPTREKNMFRFASFLVTTVTFVFVSTSHGDDWPQWRGPNRDCVSNEKNLLQSWSGTGPKLLWTFRDAGDGYSGPAVVGDQLFMMGVQKDTETIFSLDTKTGKPLWSTAIGKPYPNKWGGGPRSTPTFDSGKVYGISGEGDLICVDAKSGKKEWLVSLAKELEGKVMKIWGFSESPLVDGNKVVCSPGGPKGSIAALDKNTGKVIWRTTEITDEASYSSIIKAKVGKHEVYIQMTAGGLVGVEANTGKKLFAEKVAVNNIAIIPTPIFFDNKVYVTSDYGTGCGLVELTPSDSGIKLKVVYENKVMQNHHGGVILHKGHIYGASGNCNDRSARWKCQDVATGEMKWESEKLNQTGSITMAGGRIYLYGQNDGTVVLIDPNTKDFTETGRFKIPETTKKERQSGKIWTHPVVSNGKLFLRDLDLVFCFDVSSN